MADRWFNEFIEIELYKAEEQKGKYVLDKLMNPTQGKDLEDSIEDGFNIF